MKKYEKVLLIITIVAIVLATAVMSIIEENRRPLIVDGDVMLPFENGRFVVTDENISYSWLPFSFGVSQFQIRRGGVNHHYVASHLHQDEFLYIMNVISPVLINAAITDNSDRFREERRTPFHVTEDTQIFDYHNHGENFAISMKVHETKYHGYLYFLIIERYTITNGNYRSKLSHHSLYTITLDELEQLTNLIDSIEMSTLGFHGHPSPPIAYFFIRSRWVLDNIIYFLDNIF